MLRFRFPTFLLLILLTAIACVLMWVPRLSSQGERHAVANRVYVLVDPSDRLDIDFLSGVKAAREMESDAPNGASNLIVLSLGSNEKTLHDQLCLLPSPIRDCNVEKPALTVLGPNTTTQVFALHDQLVKICEEQFNPASCPNLYGAQCGLSEKRRWNVQFLVGNATTVVPHSTPGTCDDDAWHALRFALPDNNAQAAALLKLARAKPPVLLVTKTGDNDKFISDLHASVLAQAGDLPLTECDITRSTDCLRATANVGSIIALSGERTATTVLDALGGSNIPVFAPDTWTPNAIFRKAHENHVRTLCVVAVRHNSLLKDYVTKAPRPERDRLVDILPINWRGLEMVRYTLGWDLYDTYAATNRGEHELAASWQLVSNTRQPLEVRLDDPNARPFWRPAPEFMPRCCSSSSTTDDHYACEDDLQ